MPGDPTIVRTLALLAVALCSAGVASVAMLSSPGQGPTGLQLLVSPHPDDELMAWAALEDDPQTYTVVVTLTRGEGTANCARAQERTQAAAGERLPEPVPVEANTPECGEARVDAWRTFLDEAGRHDAEVRLGRASRHTVEDPRLGGDADFWVGTNSARASLALPDGDVTHQGTVEAVNALLEQRGGMLPDLPLRRILSASYWNDSPDAGARTVENGACRGPRDCPGDPEALEYENHDHRAATSAMSTLGGLAELGAWVVVPPSEPGAVSARGKPAEVRTLAMTPEHYDVYMALGEPGPEGPQRLGIHQVVYGWLAFPGNWWRIGDVPSTGGPLFPRQQTFLVLHGET
jgi:hypothetical protein